jgi:hypothetical protein
VGPAPFAVAQATMWMLGLSFTLLSSISSAHYAHYRAALELGLCVLPLLLLCDASRLLFKSHSRHAVDATHNVERRRLTAVWCAVVAQCSAQIYAGATLARGEPATDSLQLFEVLLKVSKVLAYGILFAWHSQEGPGDWHGKEVERGSKRSWCDIDPLDTASGMVAAGLTLNFAGFAFPHPRAFEVTFGIALVLPVGLLIAALYQQLARTTHSRKDDDVIASIAYCKAVLERRWWHFIPDTVKVLISGIFLVSLSIKLGQTGTTPSMFRSLSFASSLDESVRWLQEKRFYFVLALLGVYSALFLAFISLRVLHLPKRAIAAISLCWRMLYNLLLISALQFVMLGLRCVDVQRDLQSNVTSAMLVMDRSVECDYGYAHRVNLLASCGLCLLFCFGPALCISTLTLNRITEPRPRCLPHVILARLSSFYALVVTDLLITNTYAKLTIGSLICVALLAMHFVVQPFVGPAIVANSAQAAVYAVAIGGFGISWARAVANLSDVAAFGVFVGSVPLVGAAAFFCNLRRARRYDTSNMVAAAVAFCRGKAASTDIDAEILEVGFAASSAHARWCEEVLRGRVTTLVGADAEDGYVRVLRELTMLAASQTGCRTIRKRNLIRPVLELLTTEHATQCLAFVQALLSHSGVRRLMCDEVRSCGGLGATAARMAPVTSAR